MKRFPLIQLAILLCMAAPCAFGWNVPRERLTYDVMYKWGLINKKAGSVSLVTRPHSTKNDFQALQLPRLLGLITYSCFATP